MAYELQDPGSEPAYTIDWNDWLATGDTISSHLWSVTPSGPVFTDLGESAGFVSARLAGVLFGKIYRLSCEITTVALEKGTRSIEIRSGTR